MIFSQDVKIFICPDRCIRANCSAIGIIVMVKWKKLRIMLSTKLLCLASSSSGDVALYWLVQNYMYMELVLLPLRGGWCGCGHHTSKFYDKVFLCDGLGAVRQAILFADRSC